MFLDYEDRREADPQILKEIRALPV